MLIKKEIYKMIATFLVVLTLIWLTQFFFLNLTLSIMKAKSVADFINCGFAALVGFMVMRKVSTIWKMLASMVARRF